MELPLFQSILTTPTRLRCHFLRHFPVHFPVNTRTPLVANDDVRATPTSEGCAKPDNWKRIRTSSLPDFHWQSLANVVAVARQGNRFSDLELSVSSAPAVAATFATTATVPPRQRCGQCCPVRCGNGGQERALRRGCAIFGASVNGWWPGHVVSRVVRSTVVAEPAERPNFSSVKVEV